MFIDWKTQHRKYINSTETDKQVKLNSYQNLSRIFYSYRQDYSKIYM